MATERLLSGHEVEALSEEEAALIEKHITPFKSGLIRILPDGAIYPGSTPRLLNKICTLKYRRDDAFILTYPKAGTTWMQEVLWTMIYNPNLDNPDAKKPLLLRSVDMSADMLFDSTLIEEINPESLLEAFDHLCPGKDPKDGRGLQCLEVMEGRRIIKSHYALDLHPPNLLDQTKVVYVARNPKDLVLSYYHFFKVMKVFNFQGTQETFINMFMNNQLIYGKYWPHVKQAWLQRNHPNLHFVFFEDMKADPLAEITKLNTFFNTNLTQEQLNNVVKHTSFTVMKSRGEPITDKGLFDKNLQQKSGAFLRQGIAGDWKNHIKGDLNRKMDEWINKNNDLNIPFKYE